MREPTFIRCMRCKQPILPGNAHVCLPLPLQRKPCMRCHEMTYPRIGGMCASCWEKVRRPDESGA
jgi:hypothetical protein